MRLIGGCGREIDLHLVIHNIPRLWHQPVVGLREGVIAKARRSKGVADDLRRPVDPLHRSAYVIGSQRCQGTAKRVACAVDLEQQAKLSYLFLMWKPYVPSSVLAKCSSGEAGSILSNSSIPQYVISDGCQSAGHLGPLPVIGGDNLADAAHDLPAKVVGGVRVVKAVVDCRALPEVVARLVGREGRLPGLQKMAHIICWDQVASPIQWRLSLGLDKGHSMWFFPGTTRGEVTSRLGARACFRQSL